MPSDKPRHIKLRRLEPNLEKRRRRALWTMRQMESRARAINMMTTNARRAWYGVGPLRGKVKELDWPKEIKKWMRFWGRAA